MKPNNFKISNFLLKLEYRALFVIIAIKIMGISQFRNHTLDYKS